MLTVLPEVCAGAVGIESHTDKYDGTKRMNPNIKEVHVLLGAFADGDYVIPVQLEIKEYKPGAGLDNKLYMTVTLKKAEAGILLRAPINASAQSSIRNTPASVVSLPDLVTKVKDETGGLMKYLPDEMLAG